MALRYEKAQPQGEPGAAEQYQLFETSQYQYRVFVTSFSEPAAHVAWFYNQRAGAENLIKEANNDAGLAAHPSGRFDMNRNHFQLAMLAYNLNCWLLLFHREPQDRARNEPRDLFDLWHLITREGMDLSHLVPAIIAKLAFRNVEASGIQEAIMKKEARLKALWSVRLANQMSELPPFEQAFREFRRALRNSDLP